MAAPMFGDLSKEDCVLFVCDLQAKFRAVIQHFESVVEGANRLIQTAELLEIPFIVTEQYPSGLGPTVSELDISNAIGVFPKTRFSMIIPEVEKELEKLSRAVRSVILCGIEAHVCIQQTCIDLLKKGIQVYVVADACSSRSQMDREFALQRLRQAGAVITTTESVILQLVGDKDHPQFKSLQKLIRESMPVTFPHMNNKL